jgi:hypothetical protein
VIRTYILQYGAIYLMLNAVTATPKKRMTVMTPLSGTRRANVAAIFEAQSTV